MIKIVFGKGNIICIIGNVLNSFNVLSKWVVPKGRDYV